MKKLSWLILSLTLATGAWADSSITLTAPQITDWGSYFDQIPDSAQKDQLVSTLTSETNDQISTLFADVQTKLNKDYFSKLKDQTKLARGFANSSAAAFDNASLLSFQTYDLFAVMGGFNIAGALPSTDPAKLASSFNEVTTKGDVYLGLATGGTAVQGGLNLGFLVPNLYLSGKLGLMPALSFTSTSSDGIKSTVDLKQSLFGLGVNYTLFPQIDLLFGFVKWRGLSVGTGVTYNSNETVLGLGIPTQSQSQKIGVKDIALNIDNTGTLSSYLTDPTIIAKVSNIQSKLTIKSSSIVIPIELMTSLQALWFLNVGLGAGLDVNFPSSQITLGGGADLGLSGLGDAKFSKAGVKIVGSDTKGNGDMFVPRLATSIGLNLAIFKLEVPISYYPTTQALAVGLTGGIVW